jgi:methyl-accepting chemotaxis protein
VSKGLGISAKLLAAFAVLLAVMAAVGMFSITKIGEVNGVALEMRNRWLPASQLIGDMHAYTSQFRIRQSDHVNAAVPAQKSKAEKLMRNARNAIDGMMKDYEPLLATDEQKQAFGKLKTDWDSYIKQTDQMIALSDASDPAALDMFNAEALDGFYTVEDDILQLIELNSKGASALSAKSESIYAQARKMELGAIGAGLAISVVALFFLMRTIARPVKQMSQAVGRLVEGDLSVQVPGLGRRDELGALATALDSFKALFAADQERSRAEADRARETQVTIDAIGKGLSALADGNLTYRVDENATGPLAKLHVDYNEAVQHLSEAIRDIIDGCSVIRDGTGEIAQASDDLSQRTERQAESITLATKALGDFSSSVKQAADNARQTSTRLGVARSSAASVDETAKSAVIAMRAIEASSKEMTEIIATIDGLAFQTNLLALNAGVEAARAGPSGAGFAVVATEVRHLAQRSAEAAGSIRNLVTTSSAQISSGVSLVESSGDALQQVVSEVAAVAGLVDEIAAGTEKQAQGIAEISEMMTQMDNATQQNAAMVEESTASSRNLSNETVRLVGQLNRFKISSSGSNHAAAWTEERESAPVYRSPSPAPMHTVGNLALKADEDEWAEF